jgi:hypothetical protein
MSNSSRLIFRLASEEKELGLEEIYCTLSIMALVALIFFLNIPKVNSIPSFERGFSVKLFLDQAVNRRAKNKLIPGSLND